MDTKFTQALWKELKDKGVSDALIAYFVEHETKLYQETIEALSMIVDLVGGRGDEVLTAITALNGIFVKVTDGEEGLLRTASAFGNFMILIEFRERGGEFVKDKFAFDFKSGVKITEDCVLQITEGDRLLRQCVMGEVSNTASSVLFN